MIRCTLIDYNFSYFFKLFSDKDKSHYKTRFPDSLQKQEVSFSKGQLKGSYAVSEQNTIQPVVRRANQKMYLTFPVHFQWPHLDMYCECKEEEERDGRLALLGISLA